MLFYDLDPFTTDGSYLFIKGLENLPVQPPRLSAFLGDRTLPFHFQIFYIFVDYLKIVYFPIKIHIFSALLI